LKFGILPSFKITLKHPAGKLSTYFVPSLSRISATRHRLHATCLNSIDSDERKRPLTCCYTGCFLKWTYDHDKRMTNAAAAGIRTNACLPSLPSVSFSWTPIGVDCQRLKCTAW